MGTNKYSEAGSFEEMAETASQDGVTQSPPVVKEEVKPVETDETTE